MEFWMRERWWPGTGSNRRREGPFHGRGRTTERVLRKSAAWSFGGGREGGEGRDRIADARGLSMAAGAPLSGCSGRARHGVLEVGERVARDGIESPTRGAFPWPRAHH